MTEPKPNVPLPRDEAAQPIAPEEAAPETPAPEPWTPHRVSEWNAYYDLYVAGFVVLLAFLGSANKIQPINSALWSHLEAGRQTAEAGAPVVKDVTSIAGQGSRWINIPWLFELIHYELYATVASALPRPAPGTTTAVGASSAEQFAAGALIALDALVRGATALLLLGLRRKGPGLWWTAICVTLALGVTISPASYQTPETGAGGEVRMVAHSSVAITPGGLALPAAVAPETWGLLFFAIELLLLHRAFNLGRPGRLYGLIPLFLLWANMDESFAFGLVTLAAAAIGLSVESRRDPSRPQPRALGIVLAACFAATLVSPSHVWGVLGAFGTILRAFGLDVGTTPVRPASILDLLLPKGPKGERLPLALPWLVVFFATQVAVGMASFLINRRRFSPARFLVFASASILWGLVLPYAAFFAAALVLALALNGQEWYHDTFGTEGRMGAGWTAWSTGGRLITIALVSVAIALGVTGWGGQVGDNQFGFGFNPDDFPFEAAEALKAAPIEGNILNSSPDGGDAIAWRTGSKRKAFIDRRSHLYPASTIEEFDRIRVLIRDGQVDQYRPILERHNIAAMMVQVDEARRTFARLMSTPDLWIPFYDDGAVVLFGRADTRSAADLAYFQANRLDADAMAYLRPRPIPPWDRPPTPTYEPIDSIFQNRLLNRPQPHTAAAARWLRPATVPPEAAYLPDPAHCLMAIREARTALSIKPDDPTAFRLLIESYRRLLAQEAALIAGISLTPRDDATYQKISQAPQQIRPLSIRTRQLLTAMNSTLQTLPPAQSSADRVERARLNFELADLYLQNGALDLARERLDILARDHRPGDLNAEFLTNVTRQLGDLNQRVQQVQDRLDEAAVNRQVPPPEKAAFARSQGTPGLAIHELEEAEQSGGAPGQIRPILTDLYCDTGQPAKALDLIGPLAVDDPTLSSGIGTGAHRQGMVYLLLGNYENAVVLWRDKSILDIRRDRGMLAPMAGQALLGGQAVSATRIFLELPEKVAIQAQWEFEVALAALEGGLPPDIAVDHFQAALKLEPNLTVRPVIAYYLEKLGKPVPPPRAAEARPPGSTPAPAVGEPGPPGAVELPENVFEPETPKL